MKDATPYLVARCYGKGGDKCTWMPLQACFANTYGEITYARYGAFYKSCPQCEYEALSARMRCQCDSPIGMVDSVVKLDDYISNKEGSLSCQGFVGFSIDCNESEMMRVRTVSAPKILPDEPTWLHNI
ncbi:hypothetical protein CI238_02773 [Colletotrichum incanum]|uniref:Cyanovirin-N domain-containing protein n=1 Tax=Colletotrichum incanum TaxID=1573173 RepID=A0A167CHL9_COLIC|nr:hypothetical protein CI238_02773 [Colletotrichum incanum]